MNNYSKYLRPSLHLRLSSCSPSYNKMPKDWKKTNVLKGEVITGSVT